MVSWEEMETEGYENYKCSDCWIWEYTEGNCGYHVPDNKGPDCRACALIQLSKPGGT